LFLLICSVKTVDGQNVKYTPAYYSVDAARWADSVLATMSTDEKVGQLFMINIFSNRDAYYEKDIAEKEPWLKYS
jgi:hypothetical protein